MILPQIICDILDYLTYSWGEGILKTTLKCLTPIISIWSDQHLIEHVIWYMLKCVCFFPLIISKANEQLNLCHAYKLFKSSIHYAIINYYRNCGLKRLCLIFKVSNIGPILDDRLKGKLLKPWKGTHSSHFRVRLSVCLYAGYRAHFLA